MGFFEKIMCESDMLKLRFPQIVPTVSYIIATWFLLVVRKECDCVVIVIRKYTKCVRCNTHTKVYKVSKHLLNKAKSTTGGLSCEDVVQFATRPLSCLSSMWNAILLKENRADK